MAFSVREIEEKDLEMIMRWRMAPHVTKFMNTDPHLTISDQMDWYGSMSTDIHNMYWLVEVDGKGAGIINLRNIDWGKKSASWGYYIGEKSLRSLSLAISLEMSLYDFVFDVLGFKLLKCETFTINSGVVKLHIACGSIIVNEEKAGIEKNGVFYDITHMSIDNRSWKELKNSNKYEHISFIASRKIHHFGIATSDTKKSIAEFNNIGFVADSGGDVVSILDSDRQALITFMRNRADNTRIELIEPFDGNSAVSLTLAKMKNMATPCHICYETRNIELAILELRCMGYVIVSRPAPAIAMNGRKVAFMLKKDAGLIELLET